MRLSEIFILLLFLYIKENSADKACAARAIPNQSVVCVCNSTYCDEVTRDEPPSGSYVTYTSSQAGLRFYKTTSQFIMSSNESCCKTTLTLDPLTKYQRIKGFGGAVTDAAGINWKSLPPAAQENLVNSYYSENGIEYNMIRTPIGGSDFSTRAYAFNELPENDTRLSNYTLAPEDFNYKIPMIRAIEAASKVPVHIVATTWSPPLWMKTRRAYGGYSRLKREYYQTYADYHLRYLEKYKEQNITIWGLTTTNEPINGILATARFNSLGWYVSDMGEFIEKNFGPTLRNSEFKNIIIMTGDDQRITIPYWFNVMLSLHPKALGYIDGVAVHYYTDRLVPPAVLEAVTRTHPDKFLLGTEACEGSFPWQREKVLLGSWQRARNYILDILEDLNYYLVGWIDWNLCLDLQGGPNWANNFVDSPIIVDRANGEFLKQPMFYAMGHVSKFIPRDSVRIKVTEHKSILEGRLQNVAFITPRNTIVVVVHNDGKARTVNLKIGNKHAILNLEAHSITTVEFPKM